MLPSFDAANVGEVDLSLEGKLLLSQPTLPTDPPHIAPNDRPAKPALQDRARSGI